MEGLGKAQRLLKLLNYMVSCMGVSSSCFMGGGGGECMAFLRPVNASHVSREGAPSL
jgi:hypothetical protein